MLQYWGDRLADYFGGSVACILFERSVGEADEIFALVTLEQNDAFIDELQANAEKFVCRIFRIETDILGGELQGLSIERTFASYQKGSFGAVLRLETNQFATGASDRVQGCEHPFEGRAVVWMYECFEGRLEKFGFRVAQASCPASVEL